MANTKKWVTQKELDAILNESIQTVHNWIQRGNVTTKEVVSYGKTITLIDSKCDYIKNKLK